MYTQNKNVGVCVCVCVSHSKPKEEHYSLFGEVDPTKVDGLLPTIRIKERNK